MKESDKLISVLTSVYNGERFLKESIDSILNQTLGDFEFLIVDDASTDSTAEILSQVSDSRVMVFTNKTNQGLTANLNTLLPKCKGKYIARMDADDIALPQRFQVQYDYMEAHPETGICGSNVEVFYDATGKRQTVAYAPDDTAIRAFAFFQSPFCHPSVMLRKSVLESAGLQYPPQYRTGQDYALWIELLKYTQGVNLPDILLRFRKHDSNVSFWEKDKEREHIKLVGSIHRNVLSQFGVSLAEEEQFLYTQFTDRAIPSDLTLAAQRRVSAILEKIASRIDDEYDAFYPAWRHYLSMICFYNYYREKKMPCTLFLWRLYCRGAIYYLKRSIIKKK